MGHDVADAVQHAIRCWARAFNAADLDGLLALYSAEAVLVPTTAPQPLTDAAGLRAYFERVMARQPRLHVRLHEPLNVRAQGDWALCSGCCEFSEGEGGATAMPARFSFCWRQEAAVWRILEHHSSLAPTSTLSTP